MKSGSDLLTWPADPYRGLNYFRPQDRPLLTGRDADVAICSEMIAHRETRVLLLHGSTGCGKSSFLRAGLIPAMEEYGASYLYLKSQTDPDEALFIRCTESPIDQIARQVYLFACNPIIRRSPGGPVELSLRAALLNTSSWEEYLEKARDPNQLIQSLQQISTIMPQTLVLIVDQAEEVLTLNASDDVSPNRARFFYFLREFQGIQFDARIIVALRTEFFGRFFDASQRSYRPVTGCAQFFLSELSRDSLLEAILRPTLRTPVPPFDAPFDRYGFEFDPGVPDQIVEAILRRQYSGPALPILQLVCRGLYERRKIAGRILETDFDPIGGVEQHLIDHIRGSLRRIYTNDSEFMDDLEKLRKFLEDFYLNQDDGTAVARSHPKAWVLRRLNDLGLNAAAEALLDSMLRPESMILREYRSVKQTGEDATEITIAHDSVALAVERWKTLAAENRLSQAIAEKEKQREKLVRMTRTIRAQIYVVALSAATTAMVAAFLLGSAFANTFIVRALIVIAIFQIAVLFTYASIVRRRLGLEEKDPDPSWVGKIFWLYESIIYRGHRNDKKQ